MLTNQEIAQKWVKELHAHSTGEWQHNEEIILSAIREATTQQVEIVKDLHKAVAIHVTTIEEQVERIARAEERSEELEDKVNEYEDMSITCPSCSLPFFPKEIGRRSTPKGADEGSAPTENRPEGEAPMVMPNEEFEKLAAQFYEDTGMMAPGKDVAAAAYRSEELDGYPARTDAWLKWLIKQENRPDKQDGSENKEES